jgi:hypothetical protein
MINDNNNEPRVLLSLLFTLVLPVTLSKKCLVQRSASKIAKSKSKKRAEIYSLRACTCLSGIPSASSRPFTPPFAVAFQLAAASVKYKL